MPEHLPAPTLQVQSNSSPKGIPVAKDMRAATGGAREPRAPSASRLKPQAEEPAKSSSI